MASSRTARPTAKRNAATEFGDPSVLGVVTVPKPSPRAGQVLVKVAAATVNPTDLGFRQGGRALPEGMRPPYIPGMDLAGVIEEAGTEVSSWKAGDRVMAAVSPWDTGGGAQAEYRVVAEDQLGVGDVIDTGFATGVVENVGIRITQVRDVNGTLWYVRNGEILRVGNMSQGWARVIIDLAVPYESDVEGVQQKLLDTAIAFAGESRWKRLVLEKPELWGIESVSAEAIVIRLVVKTRSGVKDQVARALRARLKTAIDELGVQLPPLNSIALRPGPGGALPGARPAPKPAAKSSAGAPTKPSAANGGKAGA